MATKSTLFLALALLAIIATNQLLVSALPQDEGAMMSRRDLLSDYYEYYCEYKGKKYKSYYKENKWYYYYLPEVKKYCCYDKKYYNQKKFYKYYWSDSKC